MLSASEVPPFPFTRLRACPPSASWSRGSRVGLLSLSLSIFSLFLFLSPLSAWAESHDTLAEHYQTASRLISSGDRDHAIPEFRAFLAEALHRIANGRAEAGQIDSAFSLFEESLRLAPNDINLKLDYARACLDADKPVKARALAEAAAAALPNPETTLVYGRALFHMGEFPAAKTQLQRSYLENPQFNTGYLLAKTYLLLHNAIEARELFNRMAATFGDTARTHVLLGRAYSETDHRAEAIEEFHRALAKDARAPDAHYYLGLTYLGRNESAGYELAIPEFRAELQRDGSDFRSHYMLGYIALQLRHFTEAESELSVACSLMPYDLESMLKLAEVYLDTERDQQAEPLLRQAISRRKESEPTEQLSRAHYLLGRILQKRGSRQEALHEFQIVATIQKQLGPTSAQTQDARMKEAQDNASPSGIASAKNLAQLEQFVAQLRPALADSYNSLGIIAAGSGDFAQAVDYFQSASTWDSSFEGLDRNLGRAAYLAGDFRQAVTPLSRYLQAHPEDNSARSTLGLSLFHLGEYQKVIDVLAPLQAAIQSNPELSNAYSVSLSKTERK